MFIFRNNKLNDYPNSSTNLKSKHSNNCILGEKKNNIEKKKLNALFIDK